MALSKPTFLTHLKTLTKPFHHHHRTTTLLPLRFLSFSTPEEAAAARRRRKRELRIQPPQSSLKPPIQNRRPPQTQPPITNPNAPKLPEHVSVLTGKRLELHNHILKLIRENDLEEAALFTRHSIYSNCKPTIFTVNSVLAAQLRQGKYAELLSLHRFITQANVAPNIITHNIIINVYCDCRKTDIALEHYKQLIDNAPFNPSPTTYRILIKGLVENGKIEKALEIKEEMLQKGLSADPIVYGHLMSGLVKTAEEDPSALDKVIRLYEQLEKLNLDNPCISDGLVFGSLMKAYFKKGLEDKAMEYHTQALLLLDLGSYSDGMSKRISRVGAVTYNSVLDALLKNDKIDEALDLFNKMMEKHNPPLRISVNIGSFNVMVEGYCAQGKVKEALEVFKKTGEKRVSADTLSVNNMIEKLCANGMVVEAEEIYRDMMGLEKGGPIPDEFTYVLLMDACFVEGRADDAFEYFKKMLDKKSGLKANLVAYDKALNGLIKAGKIDEAKGIFDQMKENFKLEAANYVVMLKALIEAEGKLDAALQFAGEVLDDEDVGALTTEMNELITDALKKEGREEDLPKMLEERERKKEAEALAKKEAEEKAAAVSRDVLSRVRLPLSAGGLPLGPPGKTITGEPISDVIDRQALDMSNQEGEVAANTAEVGVVVEENKDDLAEQVKPGSDTTA